MATLAQLPLVVASPQQDRIYEWVRTGHGNSIAVAVAGSGKTTTLINACEFMRGSVAMVAYNKKIAVEFDTKLKARGLTHVRGGTAHSFGNNAWQYANGYKVEIDERKKWLRLFEEVQVPEYLQSFVKSLVSMAKQRGIGFLCPILDSKVWRDTVDHFDLSQELSDDEDERDVEQLIDLGIGHSVAVLKASIAMSREIIDYDDMIYMPLKANCRIWQNDWLLVDEA